MGRPMNDWLETMLIDTGVMSDTGLTRNAGLRVHKPCRARCLAGIDDSGFDTWCDPHPLTPDGELAALLEGRPTYDVSGRQLCIRRSRRIAYFPAAARPVLATHVCGHPIPDGWRLPPAPPAPRRVEGTF
jgi:hypothetical protein